MSRFEALFNESWTNMALTPLEKYLEMTRPIFSSVFQHLRLGSMNIARMVQKTNTTNTRDALMIV